MVSKQVHFVRKWCCDEVLYRKTPGHGYRLRLAVALLFILATVNRQFRYITAIFSGKRLAFNAGQPAAKLSYPGGERRGGVRWATIRFVAHHVGTWNEMRFAALLSGAANRRCHLACFPYAPRMRTSHTLPVCVLPAYRQEPENVPLILLRWIVEGKFTISHDSVHPRGADTGIF